MVDHVIRFRVTAIASLFAVMVSIPESLRAELSVTPLVQSHMVVQRDAPFAVKGMAEAGSVVSVSVAGQTEQAIVNGDGHWRIILNPLQGDGPHSLTVRAKDSGEERVFDDILVGDVWLCSGQSNMAWPVSRSAGRLPSAENPRMRLLSVANETHPEPLSEHRTTPQWTRATAEAIAGFSGVCYFFAEELESTHDVPVGAINASWGGSGIEAWVSAQGLRKVAVLNDRLDLLNHYVADPAAGGARFNRLWQKWWGDHGDGDSPWTGFATDKAVPGLRNWKTFGDERLVNHDGMVWYQNTLTLTEEQAKMAGELALGGMDEIDVTWLNGEFLGTTFGWGEARRYAVEADALRAGRNLLVSNVLSTWDAGGMYGPEDVVALHLEDGSTVRFDSDWTYRQVPSDAGSPPLAPWHAVGGLTGMSNAMIAPLEDLAIKGAIWYQGESNTGSSNYDALLQALIADWRSRWQAEFPFVTIQLPTFGQYVTQPTDSGWARVRWAQHKVAIDDPLTGVAIALDLGDAYDLHPPNKSSVARRVFQVADHLAYGNAENLEDGIWPVRVAIEGAAITLTFNADLTIVGSATPAAFEVCRGADCYYAEATLEGRTIRLRSKPDEVTRVRHCWADAPICNLYSRDLLPVSSFEVDLADPS